MQKKSLYLAWSFKLIVLVFLSLCLPVSAIGDADLSKHSIYSKYDFRRGERVINFGAQPMVTPVGVIAEAMKHDRILRAELKRLRWELSFHNFLNGRDINYFVRRGDIDIALAGEMPVMQLAVSYDINIAALARRGFVSLISDRYMRLSELKGKRIAYAPDTSSHHALLVTLHSAGLKESDVLMSPMDVNKMADALANKIIDVFSAWEPVPSLALKKHKTFRIVQRVNSYSYLYLRRDFVRDNPDIAELLMASYIRSLHWMRANSANLLTAASWKVKEVEAFIKKPWEGSIEDEARLTREDILMITSVPIINKRLLDDKGTIYSSFAFLQARGKIPKDLSFESIAGSFDDALIKKVLNNPSKYRITDFDYDR